MAKGTYLGVNDIARKLKSAYLGVDGVARKLTKAYVGDESGIAKLAWSSNADTLVMVDTISLGKNERNVAYSHDGGNSWEFLSVGSEYAFLGVTYGNGLFLGVTQYGEVYTSVDGSAWTLKTPVSSLRHLMNGLFFYDGKFFIISVYGQIVYSKDGVEWTFISDPAYGTEHIGLSMMGSYTRGNDFMFVTSRAHLFTINPQSTGIRDLFTKRTMATTELVSADYRNKNDGIAIISGDYQIAHWSGSSLGQYQASIVKGKVLYNDLTDTFYAFHPTGVVRFESDGFKYVSLVTFPSSLSWALDYNRVGDEFIMIFTNGLVRTSNFTSFTVSDLRSEYGGTFIAGHRATLADSSDNGGK